MPRAMSASVSTTTLCSGAMVTSGPRSWRASRVWAGTTREGWVPRGGAAARRRAGGGGGAVAPQPQRWRGERSEDASITGDATGVELVEVVDHRCVGLAVGRDGF